MFPKLQLFILNVKINSIGNRMVRCNKNCNGIKINPKSGIIPRCLYLENRNSAKGKGCVVVGINPGKSSNNNNRERNFYIKEGISYFSVKKYWAYYGNKKNGYYKYLRNLLSCIGYEGPILWTELAKCETDLNYKSPPLQTFRNCTKFFLKKELRQVPSDWPLFAIGRESHKALSYLFPSRVIIGIPHPTSSHGNFSKLFTTNKRNQLKSHLFMDLKNINNSNSVIWLS